MSTQRSTVAGGWRGPNIIENGLVLYLNANSPNSYNTYFPSNTWKDISGKEYNASLINGPTFVSDSGGGILYDGINDYAQGNNSLASEINDEITIISVASTYNITQRSILFSKFNPIQPFGYKLEIGTAAGFWTNTMRWYVGGNIEGNASDYRGLLSINQNQIYMFTATYNRLSGQSKMYYDLNEMTADQVGFNIVDSSWSKGTNNYRLGSFLGDPSTSPMTQYNCLVYNRVLSFAEITQNYNSFKPIYNI